MRTIRGTLWIVALALIPLLATPAHAQLNLSWDDCSYGGSQLRMFACNTDSSPLSGVNANMLVGSFVSPGLTAVLGEDAFVLVQSGVPVLPAWWRITNLDGTRLGCRPLSVLEPTFGDAAGTTSCADYFGSRGAVGSVDVLPRAAANETMIRMWCAVPAGTAGPVQAGEEDFAFTLHIRNDRTVGFTSCTGCTDGVTLTFIELRLFQSPGLGDHSLSLPVSGYSATVDMNTALCEPPAHCPPVPPVSVRRSTWGSIKSLYR